MKGLFIAACVVSVVSCGLSEVERGLHPESDGIWHGTEISNPSTACYVTALDYRDGYDWRSDIEKGSVKCSLTVFADEIPLLKVPVGDAYEVSSDPMRHRLISGHLYTDYTDGKTTVVKCDGMALYRYQGAELVQDMLVRTGQVHTLCTTADEKGLCYRINGHEVFRRESADILGHMSSWKDTVCFCFRQRISTASGDEDSYYLSKAGKISKITIQEKISKVWDMTMHEGRLCMAVSYTNGKGPYLLVNGKEEGVNLILSKTVRSCRFMPTKVLCLNVRCINSSSASQYDILWAEGKSWKQYTSEVTLSCSYADEDDFYAAVNTAEDMRGKLFKGKYIYPMPEGYCIRGRSPISSRDGVLYAGLSSSSDDCPAVWVNGDMKILAVNGPVTGIGFLR